MPNPNLTIKEIMAFVPSGPDFGLALSYYKVLGFLSDWESDELSILRFGSCRFFLQKLDNAEMRDHFMMNAEVEDLDAWWTHLQSLGLTEKFPGTRIKPPTVYPWGKREIHLIGPDGVLWHFATPAS